MAMEAWRWLAFTLLLGLGTDAKSDRLPCDEGSGGHRDCKRYKCDIGIVRHQPEDYAVAARSSVFTLPCQCDERWNADFCALTDYMMNNQLRQALTLPVVCLCRRFSDNFSKCNQFLARCFRRGHDNCSCCFNQPADYCDHIKCASNEPKFSDANTTCVCFSNPIDYPPQICHNFDYDKRNLPKPLMVNIFGLQVNASALLGIVVILLVAVAVVTAIILVGGNRRIKQRKAERQQQLTQANDDLIAQRQEDDSYLPSA